MRRYREACDSNMPCGCPCSNRSLALYEPHDLRAAYRYDADFALSHGFPAALVNNFELGVEARLPHAAPGDEVGIAPSEGDQGARLGETVPIIVDEES